jgi:uncharacterized delta-60 repeat protein
MIRRANRPVTSNRAGTALVAFLVFLFLCSPAWPQAQPRDGDLDRTFGGGGKVATRFQMISSFSAVALQRDGKIVAVGSAARARRDVSNIAIVRYLADGSLDPAFGSGGIVTSSLEIRSNVVPPVALQPDGKIVVAGTPGTNTVPQDWAVLRYNSDGTPDTSFGAGGRVTTDFESFDARPVAIVIQPNGRILVGGSGYVVFSIDKHLEFIFSRYEPDGSLDKSFGEEGVAYSLFSVRTDGMTGMALQPDGKIVATGSTIGFPQTYDWLVARFNGDGSVDASFGNDGKVITDMGRLDTSRAVAVWPNGRIVVAGTTEDFGFEGTHVDIAIARYNSDGSVDKAFGADGRVTTDLGKMEDVSGLALRIDGKIYVAGSISDGPTQSPGSSDFLLVRYNYDGTLDNRFGSDGVLTTDFGKQDQATALTLQPDGKILVAGFSGEVVAGGLDQGDFALARYIGGPIVVVDPPELFQDFALSFNGTVRGPRASKVRLTIDVVRISGFAGSVTVTPPDASALKISAKQDSVSTTGSSVEFLLKIKKSAPRGEHELIFTGRDALGRERSVPVTVAVQ